MFPYLVLRKVFQFASFRMKLSLVPIEIMGCMCWEFFFELKIVSVCVGQLGNNCAYRYEHVVPSAMVPLFLWYFNPFCLQCLFRFVLNVVSLKPPPLQFGVRILYFLQFSLISCFGWLLPNLISLLRYILVAYLFFVFLNQWWHICWVTCFFVVML